MFGVEISSFIVANSAFIDILKRLLIKAVFCRRISKQQFMSKISNLSDTFFNSRIANHAAFWVITVLSLAYYSSLFGGSFWVNFVGIFVMLPLQMAAAYFLIYFQIPHWIYKKRWILFALSFFIVAYFLAVLARLSNIYIAEPLTNYEGYDESLWEVMSDPVYLLRVYMPFVYMPAFLLLIFKMLKDRFQQENRFIKLEKEKSVAELNFLKAQMNPHFLFNTLNNIYALSKSKSEDTPEMILKLSALLDYTIYECNEKTVPVIKEWELIENYVDLQAVRSSQQLMIAIDEDIDNEQALVAPLILIALVENAFKHSLKQKGNLANIKVFLKVKDNVLTFDVFNTKAPEIQQKTKLSKKGIGVKNVKKQLALLYPNRHTMEVGKQLDSYQVTLTIQL